MDADFNCDEVPLVPAQPNLLTALNLELELPGPPGPRQPGLFSDCGDDRPDIGTSDQADWSERGEKTPGLRLNICEQSRTIGECLASILSGTKVLNVTNYC